MNLFFWKHSKKDKPVLIKKSCYDKLPKEYKNEFKVHDVLEDDSTHYVMDVNGDFQLYHATSISAPIMLDYLGFHDEGQLSSNVQDDTIQSPKFGGGSGEGAGAGGSYDQPQVEAPQQDNYQVPDQSQQSDNSCFDSNPSGGDGF